MSYLTWLVAAISIAMAREPSVNGDKQSIKPYCIIRTVESIIRDAGAAGCSIRKKGHGNEISGIQ